MVTMSLAFLSEPAGAPGGKGTQEGRNRGGRVCVCVCVCVCMCDVVCGCMVYECECVCMYGI